MKILEKLGQRFSDKELESEYKKMKKARMSILFVGVWLIFFLGNALWIILHFKGTYYSFIPSFLWAGAMLIVLILRKRIGCLFIFLTMGLGVYIIVSSLISRKQLASKMNFDTLFLVGYNVGILHRVISSQMSTIQMMLLAEVMFIIPKIWVLRDVSYDVIITHTYYLIFALSFQLFDEKTSRKNFLSIVNAREGMKKFKEMIDNYLPEAIVVFDKTIKKVLFINQAFKTNILESTTWDVRSFLGRFACNRNEQNNPVLGTEHSSGVFESSLEEVLTSTSAVVEGLYCTFKSDEGQKRSYQATTLKFAWDSQDAIILMLNDITNQENLIALRVADSNKDKALSTVSHELRTPITGILGVIELMEKKVEGEEMSHYLSICKSNAILLLSLVNSILDLQQIRAGKFQIQREEFSLQEIFTSLLSLFQIPCEQKNIKLTAEIVDGVPKHFVSDRNRLKQILINLIGNAIKFTFQGKIEISANIDELDKQKLWITVQDTGIGIAEENREKLFKVYGKLEDTRKMNTQGVGLGLTISNNLIQLLNNNEPESGIMVESALGKGSKFTFYLKSNSGTQSTQIKTESSLGVFEEELRIPIYEIRSRKNPFKNDPNPPPKQKKQNHNIQVKPGEETPKVLVVDDNPFNLIIARTMIENKGFQVQVAYNGREAIEVCEKFPDIKLIFMDCQMPVMDGYEASAILKKKMEDGELPNIPIYALSANQYEAELSFIEASKMDGFLSKPLHDATLNNTLKKVGLLV